MLLHEKVLEGKLKDKPAAYFMENQEYAERFDFVKRRSTLAQGRRYGDLDTIVLGQQFKMFENYMGFCESFGSAVELGEVPKVGIDVISGIYGGSIASFVGGTQNLKEEEGLIYFKQVKSGSTRGNVTSGQLIRDARQATNVYQKGLATERQSDTVSSTSIGLTTYNIALPFAPIRPGTITITIPGMNLEAVDNRNGRIIGVDIQGTVNYALGTATIVLSVTPTGVNDINATWDTDFEKDGNVPIITNGYDKVNVKAEIVALRGQTSVYKNFAAQMRFGQLADQDMVNTLINEITAEVNYRISNDIAAAAVDETLFDPVQGTGTTNYEHKQEFLDRWAMAQVKLRRNLGRGAIQTILAGDYVCAMFDTMSKFVPSNIIADGCHIYGTIDNKLVIRCPHYDPLEAIGCFRGNGLFEVGYMYSPYMPIYVDGSIPSPDNILVKEGLVTTWSAFKVLIPRFFTKFRLTRIPGALYV